MSLKAAEQQQGNWDRLALLAPGLTAELGNRGAVSSATGVEKLSVLLRPKHQRHFIIIQFSNAKRNRRKREQQQEAVKRDRVSER